MKRCNPRDTRQHFYVTERPDVKTNVKSNLISKITRFIRPTSIESVAYPNRFVGVGKPKDLKKMTEIELVSPHPASGPQVVWRSASPSASATPSSLWMPPLCLDVKRGNAKHTDAYLRSDDGKPIILYDKCDPAKFANQRFEILPIREPSLAQVR